jgi:hypothetical protein
VLTYWLFSLMSGLFEGLMALFPEYELPGSVTAAGEGIGAAIAAADAVFPVSTLGICLVIVLGARLVLTTIAFLLWVWQQIPFTFK